MVEGERKVTMIDMSARKKKDGSTRKRCLVTSNLSPPKNNCCRRGRISHAVETVANVVSFRGVLSTFFGLFLKLIAVHTSY